MNRIQGISIAPHGWGKSGTGAYNNIIEKINK